MELRTVRNIFTAVAIAYAAVFILLLTVNCVSVNAADPMRWLDAAAYAAFFGGALISGLTSSRLNKGGTIAPALLSGAAYIAVLFAASLFFSGGRGIGERLLLYLAAFAAAVAGGFAGRFRSARKVSPTKARAEVRRKYMNRGK